MIADLIILYKNHQTGNPSLSESLNQSFFLSLPFISPIRLQPDRHDHLV